MTTWTSIPFFDAGIAIGDVVRVSSPEFMNWANQGMTLGMLGLGRLEECSTEPPCFRYIFMDGQWIEFYEAVRR